MGDRLGTLVERFRAVGPLSDEDGEPVTIDVLAPPADDAKKAFREACGGSMPRELESFLNVSAGIRGVVDFEPQPLRRGPDGLDDLLLAYDYGNGDGLGLEPAGECCRVWWFGHDPWFLVFWGSSIAAFLERWLEHTERCRDDPAALAEPWRPTVLAEGVSPGDVVADPDQALSSFLARLPRQSVVYDLRASEPGTEIPFERLQGLVRGGRMERHGPVLAFLPPPRPRIVAPVPVEEYLERPLSDAERLFLEALPKGCEVIHERDLGPGGRMSLEGCGDRDFAFRPPFHVVYPPRKKPWWRFW